MATKTFTELVDDLDGSKADLTVSFSLEGVDYEIDLSNAHVDELHADMTKWIVAARRVGGRARRSSRTPSSAKETAKIRKWAIAAASLRMFARRTTPHTKAESTDA